MSQILTLLFSFFTIIVLAQPTRSFDTDTSKANNYLQIAISEEDEMNQIDLLTQAIILYERHPFVEQQLEANSLLAYAYRTIDDSLCVVFAEKAINLAKAKLNTDLHEGLLYSYLSLLEINTISNPEVSISNGEKALQLVEKPSDIYFQILSYIGGDYYYNNDLKKLESITVEMDDIINQDSIWNEYLPVSYRMKMQLFMGKRNFEQAINYGKQCIEENKKHHKYDGYSLGPIYVEIANNYAALGQYEEGIKWVKDGIVVANLPEDSEELASYHANLSYIYGVMPNEKLKAIEYGKQAIAILSQKEANNIYYLQVLNMNISTYYLSSKDLKNALLHVEKSLSYGDNIYIQNHYTVVLKELKRYDEALALIQESIIGLSPNFQATDVYKNPSKYEVYTDNYWASRMLVNKALILINRGIQQNNMTDINKGIETATLSKSMVQRLLETMQGFEQSKLTNSVLMTNVSSALLTGHFIKYQFEADENSLNELFSTIEQLKAMLLLETLTPSELPDSIFIEEEKLVHQMRQQEQLLEVATKDSIDFYQTALFNASVELEKFYTIINVQYPKEASNFYNIQYTTIEALQTELSPKKLVVEYSIVEGYDTSYLYIYTISKTDRKVFEVKLTPKFFEQVQTLNSLLQNPFLVQRANREKFIHLSNELYKILISPILNELKDKSNLIIIPQGQLFYIPFETLLPTNEKKDFQELNFLIKDFEVSYHYSATAYVQLKNKAKITDKSFLAFAPIFEDGQTIAATNRSLHFMEDSLYSSIKNDKFIGLPNSKKEVETIAQSIKANKGTATVLLSESATKSQILQEFQRQPFQFIHIATHGFVNYQNPKLSALACYEQDGKATEDLLFANEIQMQDIQADLVILSSCESGIGQLVQGEGLIALNRSFIYSGANNVLFSLWKVNDEYTSGLMIDFYKFYFQSESYTTALRQAKLKMLQDPITANPRYWAAFVLIGE